VEWQRVQWVRARRVMTRLAYVLINGAPASGKSKLAQMYIDEHPLTLAIDIDVVRSMLGRWLDHPIEAGLTARRMALEMARVQLSAGRDVLVPHSSALNAVPSSVVTLQVQSGVGRNILD